MHFRNISYLNFGYICPKLEIKEGLTFGIKCAKMKANLIYIGAKNEQDDEQGQYI